MRTEQKVFCLNAQLGWDSLKLSTVPIPELEPLQILIKHAAIGINFTDIEYIYGKKPLPNKDFIPGIEGVGKVVAVGSAVKTYGIGQRVGYASSNGLGFAQYSAVEEKIIFPLHEDISYEAAIINLTKGMTAHYLLRRTFFVRPKMKILIHGGLSRVAKLMLSLGKYYKAEVFATVSSREKIDEAKKLGYRDVFTYEDFDKIIPNGKFNVVYDSIGGDLLARSTKVIQPFGLLVGFGNSSNRDTFMPDRHEMMNSSLFLTYPQLQNYKQDNRELYLSALEVFALIYSGVFPSVAEHKYGFEEMPLAIKNIVERKNLGPVAIIL
jgi:NADPH2:quinone reductase